MDNSAGKNILSVLCGLKQKLHESYLLKILGYIIRVVYILATLTTFGKLLEDSVNIYINLP